MEQSVSVGCFERVKKHVCVTSVPWRLVACVAKVFIFSLYSCAARLLYLELAALAVPPCWLKKAICHREFRTETGKQTGRIKLENVWVTRCWDFKLLIFCLQVLTALALPPTCIHLSWNHDQLKSSSVDLCNTTVCQDLNKPWISVGFDRYKHASQVPKEISPYIWVSSWIFLFISRNVFFFS